MLKIKFLDNFFLVKTHYLFHLTLLFIVGICWQAYSWSIYIPLLFLFLSFIYFILQNSSNLKNYYWYYLIYCIFFIAGAYRYSQIYTDFGNKYFAFENKKITLQGTVVDLQKTNNPNYPYILFLDISSATQNGNKIEELKNCRFSLYLAKKPDILAGDIVACEDIFVKPATNKNYQEYLFKEQIVASIFLNNPKIILLERPDRPLRLLIATKKQQMIESLRNKISPVAFALISSLFFGYKYGDQKSLQQIKEDFKIWGISHYLARSGLHLVIFAGIWHVIFAIIPLYFFVKQLLFFLLILIYLLFSWTSISFLRAFLMLVFYKICIMCNAQIHALHLLVLVCFIILFYNPLQLFFLDFQLSFILTFGLIWFAEVLHKMPNN